MGLKTCLVCRTSYPDALEVCPQDGSLLRDPGVWTPGTVVNGKYIVFRQVGQGGTGSVFKARELASDEPRALKLFRRPWTADPVFLTNLRQEVALLRELRHPNIARVDESAETEDGRPFLVMEYVEGRSLKQAISDSGPLGATRVCALARQVAEALDAAHQTGLFHLDLKPANVLLESTPHGEFVKVIDFGSARLQQAWLLAHPATNGSARQLVVGTPAYLSPEQAQGMPAEQLDARADLYALGIVMYEALTCDLPFEADTTLSLLVAHLEAAPRSFKSLGRADVPAPLAELVLRLLEKRRELRPPTAGALLGEILRVERALKAAAVPPVLAAARLRSPAAPPLAPGPRVPPAAAVVSRADSHPETGLPAAAASPIELRQAPESVLRLRGAAGDQPEEPAPAAGSAELPSIAPAPVALPGSAGSILFAPSPPPRSFRWLRVMAALGILAGVFAAAGYFVANRRSRRDAGPFSSFHANFSREGKSTDATGTPPASPPAPAASEPAVAPPAAPSAGGPAAPGPAPASNPTAATAQPAKTPPASAAKPTVAPQARTAAGATHLPRAAPPRAAARAKPPIVDPAVIKAVLAEGDAFFELGEYDRAIGIYQGPLKIDPNLTLLKARVARAQKAKAAEQEYLNQ